LFAVEAAMTPPWGLLKLRYVVAAVPELLLQGLHLVLEAQLELFQTDLFDLLILGEEPLLGEGIEPLGILGMFKNKAPKFFIIGDEHVSNLSCHPADLLRTVWQGQN
jgi:hypothetical protein